MKLLFRINLALVAGISLFCLGCSDGVTPSSPVTQVQLYSQLSAVSVTSNSIKHGGQDSIQTKGSFADSLHISRVRILVSNLKMHLSKEIDDDKCHEVRLGPFLVTIDASGSGLSASSPIPDGLYDHIKLELHRFSSNEVSTYLNDPVYSDFVTGDRYTVIIEGNVYVGGVSYPFRYNSDVTVNLRLKFDDDVRIPPNMTADILLSLTPSFVFLAGTSVLDPRDPNNEEKIDEGIKRAFKSLKR